MARQGISIKQEINIILIVFCILYYLRLDKVLAEKVGYNFGLWHMLSQNNFGVGIYNISNYQQQIQKKKKNNLKIRQQLIVERRGGRFIK